LVLANCDLGACKHSAHELKANLDLVHANIVHMSLVQILIWVHVTIVHMIFVLANLDWGAHKHSAHDLCDCKLRLGCI